MTDQPPSPPPAPPGYGGSETGVRASGLAIASLVVGLAGFCIPVIGGGVGLALGIVALRQIGRSGGAVGGRGLAIGGIVASAVTLLFGLVVVGGIVTSMFMGRTWVAEAQGQMETRVQIEATANALEMYHLDVGRYPTEADGGLEALRARPPAAVDDWRGPYVKEPPADGWGHPLRYEPPDPDRPDDVRGHTYRLWSVGPDGMEDTPDDVER